MLKLFVEDLQRKLKNPLPGIEAQSAMMPVESTKERFDLPDKNVKRGGVLLLLYQQNNEVYIPLTQRHDYGGVHGGQVSLPGGKLEDQDQDIIATALRETHEEIGISQEMIAVLGTLTDLYIPPSNFRVTPVVGYIQESPDFIIDPREVKELIETPVQYILDEQNLKRKDILVRNGMRINAPYFDIHGKTVWGATAMILSEFRHLLQSL